MTWTDAACIAGLNGIAANLSHLSAHSAFPGSTGGNELTVANYARQPMTWPTATSRTLTASNNQTFSNLPTSTVLNWLGYWTAVSGGNFYGAIPPGGSPFPYDTDVAGDTIERVGHGLTNDQRVVFFGGTPPGGLVEGTTYFVVNATADTFQVAATSGGTPIVLTTAGDYFCQASLQVPITIGAGENVEASSMVIALF